MDSIFNNSMYLQAPLLFCLQSLVSDRMWIKKIVLFILVGGVAASTIFQRLRQILGWLLLKKFLF
jgi:hypothetical protein